MRISVLAPFLALFSVVLLTLEPSRGMAPAITCERVFADSAAQRSLHIAEMAHAKKSKEIGTLISLETGEILGKQEMGQAGGHLDAEFMLRMRGNIFTHNHPSGGSFSAEDIVTAIVTGTAEFRATAGANVYSLSWKNLPAEISGSAELAHLFMESEKHAIGEAFRAGLATKKLNPPADKLARAIWQSEFFMRELVRRNPWMIYIRHKLEQEK